MCGSGFRKLLNMDPIRIWIHNTGYMCVSGSVFGIRSCSTKLLNMDSDPQHCLRLIILDESILYSNTYRVDQTGSTTGTLVYTSVLDPHKFSWRSGSRIPIMSIWIRILIQREVKIKEYNLF